jgi:hypothetical protein
MKDNMELTLQPRWIEIDNIANYINDFFQKNSLSTDSINTVTMIICELVENGLKYGNFDRPDDSISVSISLGDSMITVEVSNPFSEKAHPHLKRLDHTIQWIRGYQDPFEAYVERLKEISKKPLNDEESGLGIVRIAYEGEAILDFVVGENDTLNVSAVSKFE